jgi:hypothetical protein
MKKHYYLLILLLLTTISQGFAQLLNQKVTDEKKHIEILIGRCNREGFATCKFDSAYKAGYSAYYPDQAVLNQINPKLGEITIILVMGTWCGDSKVQVPHFYKILDQLKFDINRLTLLCVDRSKTAPDIDITKLKIQLVPTFIFYRREKEIGRIIESPEESLEKDMLRIVSEN